MATIAIIAFREFFEAFLIAGIFLGVSKKLGIKKERNIKIATLFAFIVTFILAWASFNLTETVRAIFTPYMIDIIKAYLLILSSFFISFTVFSIHGITGKFTYDKIEQIKTSVAVSEDWTSLLPLIVFLLVVKEGIEAIFFNLSMGLFNNFNQNIIGFGIGFLLAVLWGNIVRMVYSHIAVGRIFKITEVFIILVGATTLTEGIGLLSERVFHFSIEPYSLFIVFLYIIIVYEVFLRETVPTH